jgi:hypothetical protein
VVDRPILQAEFVPGTAAMMESSKHHTTVAQRSCRQFHRALHDARLVLFQDRLIDRGHWLALLRRFRSRQLRRSLVGARELWVPWGLEVWMRRWSQWICHGVSLVILCP